MLGNRDFDSTPPDQMLFEKVSIIGMGLMGGSLAAALKANGLCREVLGYSRKQETLDKSLELGLIDKAIDTLELAMSADLVVLCTPLGAFEPIMKTMSRFWRPDVIITDVGSVKASVVHLAKQVFPDISHFVPGHPIAGSEKSGVEASKSDLFEAHRVILTPVVETSDQAIEKVRQLWVGVGAKVSTMDIIRHDEILAATSHLPHMLAFSLVDTLSGNAANQEIFRYAAGGFRDFTRIAASDPQMWHDICVANRSAILESIDQFRNGLDSLVQALDQGDKEAFMGIFTRARVARKHFEAMLSRRAYTKGQVVMNQYSVFNLTPGGRLLGDIQVPGDKSVSHRSIMLGALADGTTEISGFLEGEDALATLQAFRDMGVLIEGPDLGKVVVHGVGLFGLQPPPGPLYLGNSGTSIRLLAGILAAQRFDTELMGDESLSKRPMARIADPLRKMGAKIETSEGGRPPLKVFGGQPLKGIHYDMPVASAQVKSSLLLAGLYAEGTTSVIEPAPTRDHTERMLSALGYSVSVEGQQVSVAGGGELRATQIEVPSDISSAAFFIVGASIALGSDLCLRRVGMNPTRIGVINILKAMGADIQLNYEGTLGGEPVADIRVRSAQLKGIDIPLDQVPLAIDEFPAIFVAAACAQGMTRLRGAEELRVKESDRIQVMADGLAQLGIENTVVADGIDIIGGQASGGIVDSHGDHRIAMSFAMLALCAKESIQINNCENVATSFPGFVELAKSVGLQIQGR